jgi:hypothetical protein
MLSALLFRKIAARIGSAPRLDRVCAPIGSGLRPDWVSRAVRILCTKPLSRVAARGLFDSIPKSPVIGTGQVKSRQRIVRQQPVFHSQHRQRNLAILNKQSVVAYT